MLRPFPISKISTSFVLMTALSTGVLAMTSSARGRGKTSPVRHKPTATASEVKPAPPKSATELQQDLASNFKTDRFAHDAVQVQVEQQNIVLTGTVHGAEDKGLATTQSRLIAHKDGWNDVHVLNRLQVSLPQSW